jgi:membrane peptidoglycan carboxypeptidase
MDTQKLNDWLQIVGIFAVVASLLFVGLQLKQSQDIALSQASQARTAMSIETLISTTENANYISAVAKGRDGRHSEQTIVEQVTMSQYARAVLMSYEDQTFQYNNGFLTDERWEAVRAALKNFLRHDSNMPVRQTFERLPARYSASFQEIVYELLAEIDESNATKLQNN